MDTVYVDIKNREGCRLSAEAARLDGFTGKVAIHPDQVPIINEAFTRLSKTGRILSASK
jgi:citrate lyase subunit beta / citryl-CoA lyase